MTPGAVIDGVNFTVGPQTVAARLKTAFAEYTRVYAEAHPELRRDFKNSTGGVRIAAYSVRMKMMPRLLSRRPLVTFLMVWVTLAPTASRVSAQGAHAADHVGADTCPICIARRAGGASSGGSTSSGNSRSSQPANAGPTEAQRLQQSQQDFARFQIQQRAQQEQQFRQVQRQNATRQQAAQGIANIFMQMATEEEENEPKVTPSYRSPPPTSNYTPSTYTPDEPDPAALQRAVESARLRAELDRARTSAREIAEGIALTQESAAAGDDTAWWAQVFSPVPMIKQSADTFLDVAAELGGPGAKIVGRSYKSLQDGFDIYGEAEKKSPTGVVIQTSSMIANAGKLADTASGGHYKSQVGTMGTVVKMAETAHADDWLKALENGVDVGLDSAGGVVGERALSVTKAVKKGAFGAIGIVKEAEAALERQGELSDLRTRLGGTAARTEAQFGPRVAELNQQAEALERQLRALEAGNFSPVPSPPTTGKGEPMVLPDIPIFAPRSP